MNDANPPNPPRSYEELSPTDRAIVELLRGDGRLPFREIARVLGTSESLVRKRVHRLLDSGFIRILAVSDPLRLGIPVLAATVLQVHPHHLERVTELLSEREDVRYVATGMGMGNAMIESLHRSLEELEAFLSVVGALPGVETVRSMHVIRIKKSVWDWKVPEGNRTSDSHERRRFSR